MDYLEEMQDETASYDEYLIEAYSGSQDNYPTGEEEFIGHL